MRVLILDGGDKTPYLSRLVVRLAGLGVEMHYGGDPSHKDFDALEAAGVRCHELRVRHKLDFSVRRRIRHLLDAHEIQVLQTVTGRDAYVGVRARGRRPVKVLVRRGAYAKISRFDPADIFVYGRRGADRFLAVSRDLARHMVQRGLAPERVTTVYTGVWSDELKPVPRDLRADHGLGADTFLLGLVGELRPVKGWDYLLDALEMLRIWKAPFHLFVAGRGYAGTRKGLEQRGLADAVTLLGHLPDVCAFTPNLDCLVLPSRIDALPRAAIEATLLGTPVIGTSVGGIPEILDGGAAGQLTDPRDPADLAKAIESGITDRSGLEALAAAALQRNRELFGIERCAKEHVEIYESVVG